MLLATLLLLALTPAAAPAAAPAPVVLVQAGQAAAPQLEGLVARELANARDLDLDEIWARSQALREAERLGDRAELDRLLDEALRDRGQLTPGGVLLAAAARLQGGEADPGVLADALEPLLGHADGRFGIAAAELLTRPTFRTLRPAERKQELGKRLVALAEDGELAPEQRVAYARAAFAFGDLSGRSILREFLRSSDPALSALGALTMAANPSEPVEGPLRERLERLAELPTPDGRLAQSFLRRAEVDELRIRQYKDLRRTLSTGKMDPKFEELDSILDMVQGFHIEGDAPSRDELVEAAINGMLQWMDQHSSYLSSDSFAKFYQDLEAEYGGIGAYVNENPDTGLFSIVRPIYSGPAYKADLRSDDAIVRIDDWPTLGKPVDEIIKHLKGQPGTSVRLYIWRRGMDGELIDRPTEDMIVDVIREQIEIPAGAWQLLPGKIGMVELSTFSRVAMKGLRESILEMQDEGMRALVLDMRRNSGGLLTQAREVADLFLPKGKVVVSQESRLRDEPDVLSTRFPALVDESMPIIVLTSRFTASAAEIVAGALRDHGRAALVGRRTFGKGSVQQLLPVDGALEDEWDDQDGDNIWDPWEPILVDHDGDGVVDYAPRIKLTIARYLLPSGESIHRELDSEGSLLSAGGIEPDHEVRLPSIESWRFREQRRVLQSDVLRSYVDNHWEAHRERFELLAVNDGKDTERYPDFSRLMVDLETTLPRDDVRRMLREELRRRVQDERGQEFPFGDFVEDVQVQKAIQLALEQLGEQVDDITEYGQVFDLEAVGSAEDDDLAIMRPDSPDLHRASALLREARDGGASLSRKELDILLELIDSAQHD
ncbi:MAG: S41 family peptidase [Planctomycetota bacterium]